MRLLLYRISLVALLVSSMHLTMAVVTFANPQDDAASRPHIQFQTNRVTADQLVQQGNQHYNAGRFDAAIRAWEQARRIYQQIQETQAEGKVLSKLGAIYILSQRYQNAITTLESFLPIAQSLNDHQREAQALGNLGIAYTALGNYSKAVQVYQQAGKLMWDSREYRGLGTVLLNLGKTFATLGDYSNAEIAYQQSIKLAQQAQDFEGESIALGNLGVIYANLDKRAQAIALYNQGLAIAQTHEDRSLQASALINLGTVYHASGDRNKALNYYQQALQIAQTIGDHQRESKALSNLGIIYEDLHNYSKAIEFQEQSLAIAQKSGDPAAQGIALNNLGHALFSAGQFDAAEAKLRAAIALLDALRPGLSDTYKVSIFDTQVHTYNLLQQVLVAAKKPEAALEVSEQGRARAFAELLSGRITAEGKQHSRLGAESSPNIEKIRQIAREQNATLVEYSIVPDDNFKFHGKQRGREQELFIWVIQPNGKISLRRSDLRSLWQKNATLTDVIAISRCLTLNASADCGALVDAIRGSDRFQTTPSQYFRQTLYRLLIEQIADLLPPDPTAHIIFIPQESLFVVPFAALQRSDGKYLIESHTLLSAPSLQVLALTHRLQQQRKQQLGRNFSIFSNPDSTLIVGNPVMPKPLPRLPYAEQEAIDIAQLFHTTAILGDQATKANVLKKLSTARLVHLATHGLLDYGNPKSDVGAEDLGVPGAIALAPSGQDNGFLTASEILNLRLNADLVTLSACETGRGRISGDGVIGLSRSLIAAGAPSVVVSLWSIQDEATARFMTVFYQTLKKQDDKAVALRQAMLEIMEEDRDAPYYWAAFTLIGETD